MGILVPVKRVANDNVKLNVPVKADGAGKNVVAAVPELTGALA